mmetsp:Transcript_21740/g.70023  ORF Transcript_21740/g.70023 Transcript_21740/m.70023 type:complete len:467 (-) Transcript_21740:1400-2800(-)
MEEIPEPLKLGELDRWKATATQRVNTVTGEQALIINYVISHADGRATLRTVTKEGGETTTEDVQVDRAPDEQKREPIGAPRDLPEDARWTAKRQILTDEKGIVTTKIVYRVTKKDGKAYTQTEERTGNGPVSVAKGRDDDDQEEDDDINADDEGEPEEQKEDDFDLPGPGGVVVCPPPPPQEEPSTVEPPTPPPDRRPAATTTTPRTTTTEPSPNSTTTMVTPGPVEEKQEEELKEAPTKEPILPPKDLPEGASWKATRESVREGDVRTVTTIYDVIHNGVKFTQTERKVGSEVLPVEKTEPVPCNSEETTSMGVFNPQKPISAPRGLPSGAGWKARRESTRDDAGVVTMVTTYDVTFDGHVYAQKETVVGDGPVTIEKGPSRQAPGAGLAKKPISPPLNLPQGAGWKAKREVLTDHSGVSTATTKYLISVREPSGAVVEFDQTEVQVGDGPLQVTDKSPTRPAAE